MASAQMGHTLCMTLFNSSVVWKHAGAQHSSIKAAINDHPFMWSTGDTTCATCGNPLCNSGSLRGPEDFGPDPLAAHVGTSAVAQQGERVTGRSWPHHGFQNLLSSSSSTPTKELSLHEPCERTKGDAPNRQNGISLGALCLFMHGFLSVHVAYKSPEHILTGSRLWISLQKAHRVWPKLSPG